MKINLKQMHDAYLARQEARVEVDVALRTKLREQLFPQRRQAWLMPTFAMAAVVALVVIVQFATPTPVAFSPGPESDELFSAGTEGAKDVYVSSSEDSGEVVLSAGEVEISGLRGSYCDETKCVDTIAPWDGYNGDFTAVVPPLMLRLPREALNVQFGLRDEDGTALLCILDTERIDATTYQINDCGEPGFRYYLDVVIWWLDGGDASYVYPLEIK